MDFDINTSFNTKLTFNFNGKYEVAGEVVETVVFGMRKPT